MFAEELYDEISISDFSQEVFIEIDDRVLRISEVYRTSQGIFIVAETDDRGMR